MSNRGTGLKIPYLEQARADVLNAVCQRAHSDAFYIKGIKYTFISDLQTDLKLYNDKLKKTDDVDYGKNSICISVYMGEFNFFCVFPDIPFHLEDLRKEFRNCQNNLPIKIREALFFAFLDEFVAALEGLELPPLRWSLAFQNSITSHWKIGHFVSQDAMSQQIMAHVFVNAQTLLLGADILSRFPKKKQLISLLKIPVRLTMKPLTMSISSLKSLKNGDIIILDKVNVYEGGIDVYLKIGKKHSALALLQEGSLEIKGFETMDSLDLSKTNSLMSVDAVSLSLNCVLADIEMSVGDISALASGVSIPLPKDCAETVELRIGNQRIARGELVQVDENICMLVKKIFSFQETQ